MDAPESYPIPCAKSDRLLGQNAGLVRAYAGGQWFTKCFVIWAVFWLSIGGPAIGAAIFAFFDQAVRNTVDGWMSGPEVFERIALNEEQFTELPLEWRQTLSEIELRPEGEALDAKRVAVLMAAQKRRNLANTRCRG